MKRPQFSRLSFFRSFFATLTVLSALSIMMGCERSLNSAEGENTRAIYDGPAAPNASAVAYLESKSREGIHSCSMVLLCKKPNKSGEQAGLTLGHCHPDGVGPTSIVTNSAVVSADPKQAPGGVVAHQINNQDKLSFPVPATLRSKADSLDVFRIPNWKGGDVNYHPLAAQGSMIQSSGEITAFGYGNDENDNNVVRTRRSKGLTVKYYSTDIGEVITTAASGGICGGDSGGPQMDARGNLLGINRAAQVIITNFQNNHGHSVYIAPKDIETADLKVYSVTGHPQHTHTFQLTLEDINALKNGEVVQRETQNFLPAAGAENIVAEHEHMVEVSYGCQHGNREQVSVNLTQEAYHDFVESARNTLCEDKANLSVSIINHDRSEETKIQVYSLGSHLTKEQINYVYRNNIDVAGETVTGVNSADFSFPSTAKLILKHLAGKVPTTARWSCVSAGSPGVTQTPPPLVPITTPQLIGLSSTSQGQRHCTLHLNENNNNVLVETDVRHAFQFGKVTGKQSESPFDDVICGGNFEKCSAAYPRGTQVTLTATAENSPNEPYTRMFSEWENSCPCEDGKYESICRFTISQESNPKISCAAFFQAAPKLPPGSLLPPIMTKVDPSPTTLRMRWAQPENQGNYTHTAVYCGEEGQPFQYIGSTPKGIETYHWGSLKPDTSYGCYLAAFNNNNGKQSSGSILRYYRTLKEEIPDPPKEFQLMIEENPTTKSLEAVVSWVDDTNEEEFRLVRFENGVAFDTARIPVGVTSKREVITEKSSYYYTLFAINHSGSSEVLTTETKNAPFAKPLKPEELTWMALPEGEYWRVTLQWTRLRNASESEDALSEGEVLIYRNGEEIDSFPEPQSEYTFQAHGGHSANYQIAIRRNGLLSEISNPLFIQLSVLPPVAPFQVTANTRSNGIELSWSMEGSPSVTLIERARSVKGPFTYVGKAGESVSTYLDRSVEEGQTYVYRLHRENKAGASPPVYTEEITYEPIPLSYYNSANPLDVNNDGVVTVLDSLMVINALLTQGMGTLPEPPVQPVSQTGFLDVNGDGELSTADALLVINHLLTETP